MSKKLILTVFACALFLFGANNAKAAYVDFYANEGDETVYDTMEGVYHHERNITVIDVEDPEQDGYEFTGWAPGDENVTIGENDEGQATVNVPWRQVTNIYSPSYANNFRRVSVFGTWKPIEYTIEYDLVGGEATGEYPETYTVEDEITIADPTKEGYEFLGWVSEEGEDLGKDLVIPEGTTGDIVLTAAWKKNAEATTTENGTTVVKTKNPQTGDSTLFSISLISAGLVSLIGAVVLEKKAVKNN